MPTALQVADWLVDYHVNDLGTPLDPMSLEKHLYYAQAFHLAVTGNQIFAENFQAWRRGPVVRSVWDHYAGPSQITGKRRAFKLFAVPNVVLQEDLAAFLKSSVSLFAAVPTFELSRATHLESPWLDARGDLPPNQNSEAPIQKAAMRNYYAALINDGEEALSCHSLLGTVPDPRWGWYYVAGICARRMTNHPMYIKGLAIWGADRRLWTRPAPDEYAAELYSPPPENRSDEDFMEFESEEEFRSAYRALA